MRRILAWGFWVFAAAAVAAQDVTFYPEKEVVFTKKDAVIAMPPTAISNNVLTAEWSPSGKYVLMTRRPPMPMLTPTMMKDPIAATSEFKGPVTLSAWNRQTGRTLDLGRVDRNRFESVWWFEGSEVGVALLKETESKDTGPDAVPNVNEIMWVFPTRGELKMMKTPVEGIQEAYVVPAPRGNLALIYIDTRDLGVGYLIVDAMGRLIRTQMLDSIKETPSWHVDGQHIFIARNDADLTKPNPTGVVEVNAISGERTNRPFDRDAFGSFPQYAVHTLELEYRNLSEPPHQAPPILYLKGEEETSIALSLNATDGFLSEKEDCVVYIEFGVAMARELVRIPREQFLEYKLQAVKREAINNAKQVALGLIMYAADYDDVLPTPADWEEKVDPYLKNRETMKGFAYTFGGGNLTEIKDPSQTELGFILIPGGRVVAYADTSVRFIPNAPAMAMDRPKRFPVALARSPSRAQSLSTLRT